MEREVDGSTVKDCNEDIAKEATRESQDQSLEGEINLKIRDETMIGTRKRKYSHERSGIASPPYYDQNVCSNHVHSNAEDLHAHNTLPNFSFQRPTPSDACRRSANREDKRIVSRFSPVDASFTHQKRSNVHASLHMESNTIEGTQGNLNKSINSRSNAYLLSPHTHMFSPQQRAQASMLENVYTSGDSLRNSDCAGTLDRLYPSPLGSQSIISQSASLLKNEKRRRYIALQDMERARLNDLQVELRMYAEQNNRQGSVQSLGGNQTSSSLYTGSADRDDIRGGNQEVDANAYFLANSVGRHGNHILPSRENHHTFSRARSADFGPNKLSSTSMHEASLSNPDRPFIHRMPTSKQLSFSGRELNNDVTSRQSPLSHLPDPHPFPQAHLGPQSNPYDMAILRHHQESIDPADHIEMRTVSLPELPRHFRDRVFVPLGTVEDEIWLSPFLCFLRSQCIEMFRAKDVDVSYRRSAKTKVEINQIGIRCRFCAHKPYQSRGKRSSSFPSSVSRIYQSVTMMIREHFHSCSEFPEEVRNRYCALKNETTKGELESKRYWAQSASKLGMADTEKGIFSTNLTHTSQLL